MNATHIVSLTIASIACVTDLRTRRIPNVLTFGASRCATALTVQFFSDDSGQDLIEYALLTAIIGISGVLILEALSMTMGAAYSSWNTASQNAWEPGPPQQ